MNSYLLSGQEGLVLVDPGADAERLFEIVLRACESGVAKGQGLVAIALTHGHLDHIAAIPRLLPQLSEAGLWCDGPKILAHEKDEAYFGSQSRQFHESVFEAMGLGPAFSTFWQGAVELSGYLEEGAGFPISSWAIIQTPGHTRGGLSFYSRANAAVLSGDCLFRDSYGRTDGPDADPQQLRSSIFRLLELPEETILYPGHNAASSIGREKKRYFY